MQRLLLMAVTFGCALTVLVWAPLASAGDVQCTSAMNGPIAGNVVVPAGMSCRLIEVQIRGNVTVQKGANLVVRSSSVSGNYTCNKCGFADLRDSTLGGNFQVNGEVEGSFVVGNTIEGDVQIKSSTAVGASFDVSANTVGGNLAFNDNTGFSAVLQNTVAGNLQCQNNTPPPIIGNNVAKSMQGQCTF
jgi:hypothetical protein